MRASGVFPARMADFQAAVQCACVSNWWALKIRSRIEFAQDLQAADAVYHKVCCRCCDIQEHNFEYSELLL